MRSICCRSSGVSGGEMHEVESQAIGRDERAGLLDVRAEHLAQRRMQQMRGRVIAARRIAPLFIDLRGDDVAQRRSVCSTFSSRCARGSPAPSRTTPVTRERPPFAVSIQP